MQLQSLAVKHAEFLARNGHRVVCIEQTETPAQLAERKKRDAAREMAATASSALGAVTQMTPA